MEKILKNIKKINFLLLILLIPIFTFSQQTFREYNTVLLNEKSGDNRRYCDIDCYKNSSTGNIISNNSVYEFYYFNNIETNDIKQNNNREVKVDDNRLILPFDTIFRIVCVKNKIDTMIFDYFIENTKHNPNFRTGLIIEDGHHINKPSFKNLFPYIEYNIHTTDCCLTYPICLTQFFINKEDNTLKLISKNIELPSFLFIDSLPNLSIKCYDINDHYKLIDSCINCSEIEINLSEYTEDDFLVSITNNENQMHVNFTQMQFFRNEKKHINQDSFYFTDGLFLFTHIEWNNQRLVLIKINN